MKSISYKSLCLVLLGLLCTVWRQAQEQVNDSGDVIFLDENTAIVCSFGNNTNISPASGSSSGNTLNLGGFMPDSYAADKIYFFGNFYYGKFTCNKFYMVNVPKNI